jgi:two-component system, sensor histidine kinase LadS
VKENEQSKEEELHRKQLEKERLEEEVRVRTEEIQQQNEKLEEVNRIKDKLFSVVSHDIKGPLTALQLALSLTKDASISQAEFRELTLSLETRFKQTTEFIDNLLQWAKLQLRGGSFEPVEIHMNGITEDTIALLTPEMEAKGIVVKNLVDTELKGYGDKNMLRSVLRNLLMNAIKFTSKGGTIIVRGKATGADALMSVSDTGIGIPAINRDKIFSLDIVTTPGTKQEKGTGLGLVLCKEFVERNGGRIWFESQENIGTTFNFTLPLSVEERFVIANSSDSNLGG